MNAIQPFRLPNIVRVTRTSEREEKLLKRSFGIDMDKCPFCGSENFKAVAMIEDPDVVQKILLAVGLEARAPPIAPPRTPQELEFSYIISRSPARVTRSDLLR